jgi:hypothetical protein
MEKSMRHKDKTLTLSYEAVGQLVWSDKDFEKSNLASSVDLFEGSSLQSGSPHPKALEVYALLSGLPFSKSGIDFFSQIQNEIEKIIPGVLKYWVEPQNLGVEYSVLKWPESVLSYDQIEAVDEFVKKIVMPSFDIFFHGVQVHRDGCIVVRGFDEGRKMRNFREQLADHFDFLPRKQSSWCHVPLGRILSPVGEGRFQELKRYFANEGINKSCVEKIENINMIHETRWYMKERKTLYTYNLNN